MPLTLLFQRKKGKKETVRKKTFIKWSCRHYFDIEVDSNDNVTRVTCNICTLYLPQIRAEARGKKFHGTVSELLLKSAVGLDSTHKVNIDKHGKSGEKHDSSIWKLNNRFVTKCPFTLVHNSASPEFFFYITCFNQE